jgi:hypothetical protein
MAVNLPSKPPTPGANATEQQRLEWQDKMQAYWFAVNNIQNVQNQEALSKSNMQKAEHDALMEVARNLK